MTNNRVIFEIIPATPDNRNRQHGRRYEYDNGPKRSFIRSSWKMFELLEPRKRHSRKAKVVIKVEWRH